MDESQIGGIAFIGVGGFLVLLALFIVWRTKRFLRDAVTVPGTVTGLAMGSGGEGGTVYHPIVSFTAMDGQEIQFQDKLGSNPPSHQPGEMVEVRYLPSNPQKARLAGRFRTWFVPGLLGLLGIVFVGVGIPWYLSAGGDPSETRADPTVPATIPTNLPGVVLPTDLPTEVPSGRSFLAIQVDGRVATTSATCEGVEERRNGRTVEVRLAFEGESLRFTVRRARGGDGSTAYPVGDDLRVRGSFFEGASGPLQGAVVLDASGRSGAVNLVRGDRSVSGTWTCEA
ncbi:MAG TPA: DUF3592 domain-containing protein [Actinomycetota bacterium]|nr:DUF3592 domain-containing protein [Actinomycetota bacterium]